MVLDLIKMIIILDIEMVRYPMIFMISGDPMIFGQCVVR